MRQSVAAVFGALAGFCLGFMAAIGLASVGVTIPPDWPVVFVGLAVAACGGVVGAMLASPSARSRTIARWCIGVGAVVGGIGFVGGFVGPIVFHPDLPQGPLLGIFVTGPLGAAAGCVAGLLIGCVASYVRAH
jgi:hypothetical protein